MNKYVSMLLRNGGFCGFPSYASDITSILGIALNCGIFISIQVMKCWVSFEISWPFNGRWKIRRIWHKPKALFSRLCNEKIIINISSFHKLPMKIRKLSYSSCSKSKEKANKASLEVKLIFRKTLVVHDAPSQAWLTQVRYFLASHCCHSCTTFFEPENLSDHVSGFLFLHCFIGFTLYVYDILGTGTWRMGEENYFLPDKSRRKQGVRGKENQRP